MINYPGPLDENDPEYLIRDIVSVDHDYVSEDLGYALVLRYQVFESKLRSRRFKHFSTFYLLLVAVISATAAVIVSVYTAPIKISNIVNSPIPSLFVILVFLLVSAMQSLNEFSAIRGQAYLVLKELNNRLYREKKLM
jgi:hypothetical protein